MCDWSPNHGYEIYPTFDGLRRAKTHMKCDECSGRIVKRSRYHCYIGKDEDWETHRFNICRPCKRIIVRFSDVHGDAPSFKMLGDALAECVEREESELEELEEDEDIEREEAQAAIREWNRALTQMTAREKAFGAS